MIVQERFWGQGRILDMEADIILELHLSGKMFKFLLDWRIHCMKTEKATANFMLTAVYFSTSFSIFICSLPTVKITLRPDTAKSGNLQSVCLTAQ